MIYKKTTNFCKKNIFIQGKNASIRYLGELPVFYQDGVYIFILWQNSSAENTIILRTYQQWGKDFRKHLTGDFSILLYDTTKELLLVSRDCFGVLPIYYQYLDNELIISTEIKDILAISSQEKCINQQKIAEYLTLKSDDSPVSSATFYDTIYRILPAHQLLFQAGKCCQECYWKINLQRFNFLKTDEDYIQTFRALLTESVRKNYTSAMAANLSGGLDSSSLCSLSQMLYPTNEPLKTFYLETHTASSSENFYAELVANHWKTEHYQLNPSENIYEVIRKSTETTAQPEQMIVPPSIFFPIFEKTQKLACENLLSGHGGDNVVGYGYEYFSELHQAKQWQELDEALSNFSQKRNLSENFTQDYFDQYFSKLLKNGQFLQFFKEFPVIKKIFAINEIDFIRATLAKVFHKFSNKTPTFSTIINPDFLPKKTADIFFQANQLADELSEWQVNHINGCFLTLGSQFMEELHGLAKVHEIENRYPFFDKDLLELCLIVPARLRFGNGLGRGIFREAMHGILPEEVRQRNSKAAFNEYNLLSFKKLWNEIGEHINKNHAVWEYADQRNFQKLISLIFNPSLSIQQKSTYIWLANRVIYLSIWLDFLKK